jgi:hypothetical protein
MDIIETIDNALSSALTPLSISSFYGWYDEDIQKTHVTFIQLNDADVDYSDGEAEATEYYIQVDIWSKENIESLKKVIKTAMKTINSTYYGGQDFYEKDTKIFHKVLRFYIQEAVI